MRNPGRRRDLGRRQQFANANDSHLYTQAKRQPDVAFVQPGPMGGLAPHRDRPIAICKAPLCAAQQPRARRLPYRFRPANRHAARRQEGPDPGARMGGCPERSPTSRGIP